MTETKNHGEKTLSVTPTKTLTLKRGVEQGVVRQSFSHGRTKAVVVEKVKRRIVGPAEAAAQILRDWPDDLALVLEPGRSLVGRAGVSLHTVGTVKEVPGVRTYVAIDGGMSDNIRHALYGARFEFLLADRADAPAALPARIVGKHCESGDVVGDHVPLPADVRVGDVLVTAATGAYCWAMASNYNQLPRPAIVFCRDGEARVVVEREGIDDLLRLHHP